MALVDVDLTEFDDDEIREYCKRNNITNACNDNSVIAYLKENNCPEYLIELIKKWQYGRLSISELMTIERH